ncbi:MAG: alpha/beta hydrolase [Chloroflexi bacterium]|nr:alpha/beta hydrolase [Chloroflexota bacterium]
MQSKKKENHTNYISEGDGPPVILLHGFAASLNHWGCLIPDLVSAGFSVYAPDLLGHGDSLKPEDIEAYHVEQVFNHLESWIEGLELKHPLTLIGHSLGAFLSMIFSIRKPGMVKRIVLVDPLYSPKQTSIFVRFYTRRPDVAIKIMQATPGRFFNPFINWKIDLAKELPAKKVRLVARDFQRIHPNVIYTPYTTWDLTPQLHAIQEETLVIWGDKDRTLSPRSFPRLVDLMPNAKSFVLRKTGHAPHLTESSAFNQQVLEFLNGGYGEM